MSETGAEDLEEIDYRDRYWARLANGVSKVAFKAIYRLSFSSLD